MSHSCELHLSGIAANAAAGAAAGATLGGPIGAGVGAAIGAVDAVAGSVLIKTGKKCPVAAFAASFFACVGIAMGIGKVGFGSACVFTAVATGYGFAIMLGLLLAAAIATEIFGKK